MLANQLTLDDEDAVQEELKALEAVSIALCRHEIDLDPSFSWHKAQIPSPEIQLPSPPTTEPVSAPEVLDTEVASLTAVGGMKQPPDQHRVAVPA
jgi:hypothetical protein